MIAGVIHVPELPGPRRPAQASITLREMRCPRGSRSAAASRPCAATGVTRNSSTKSTIRGSGLHHSTGWSSLYQGKIPMPIRVDRGGRATSPALAASRPFGSSSAVSSGGKGVLERKPRNHALILPAAVECARSNRIAVGVAPAPIIGHSRRTSSVCRCRRPSPAARGPTGSPAYAAYHDNEWGVPVHDDRVLLRIPDPRRRAGRPLVVDDPQQARRLSRGVRRRSIRAKVARFDARRIERLLSNPGIVRNRLKIESAVDQRARVPSRAARIRQLRSLRLDVRRWRARSRTAGARSRRSRRARRNRTRFRRISTGAASASSARRSCTRSCRRPVSSTTTWSNVRAGRAVQRGMRRVA